MAEPLGTSSNTATGSPVQILKPAAKGGPGFCAPHSALGNLLVLLPLALLWLILFNQLWVAWSTNPQYSYGWFVPILSLSLLLRRWPGLRTLDHGPQAAAQQVSSQWSAVGSLLRNSWSVVSGPWSVVLVILSAFSLLPLRLVLEANPNWPTPQWLLAGAVVALTLWAISRWRSVEAAVYLAFPVCFILVAVPWPPSLEVLLIQGLTRLDVASTVEALGWLGVPAIQHANLVEVGTGIVNVDEACSGIRSFQSSLMVALFLGEFFRLGLARRWLLVPAGFLVAFSFNVCRTTLLSFVAAKKGVAAISAYHDLAGVSILLACIVVLGALAYLLSLRRPVVRSPVVRSPVVSGQWSVVSSLCLLAWILAVEAGVELWYRAHETRRTETPQWTVNWPPKEPGFQEIAVSAVAREMLGYGEGHCGAWRGGGRDYTMYYFKWPPGKRALAGARSHTPNVCLAAAGKQLRDIGDNRCPLSIHSVVFPFRRYEFEENGREVHVFHCLWEENTPGQYAQHHYESSTMALRLNAVLEGRRNRGQRSLEIIVSGAEDAKAAREAVTQELERLITVPDRTPAT